MPRRVGHGCHTRGIRVPLYLHGDRAPTVSVADGDPLIWLGNFIGLVRSQLSLWDVLWFGLAIATAWRIMARHPEPKAGTAEA